MVTADLLSRARAGDGEAFRDLAESHRRELPATSGHGSAAFGDRCVNTRRSILRQTVRQGWLTPAAQRWCRMSNEEL
jgi:hypothetical protein